MNYMKSRKIIKKNPKKMYIIYLYIRRYYHLAPHFLISLNLALFITAAAALNKLLHILARANSIKGYKKYITYQIEVVISYIIHITLTRR